MINKYRPEIDGLRALAIIPVIFFHAGFINFSGGYVGVDIFFVVSGYLITTIILQELDNNTFSFKNFYERRARRIFPALFFVIFVTSIISFIFLTTTELGNYFKSAISSLLFYSNFYFWKTSPYFISDSHLEPLLHTWSLSIEEQFYVIFPIILITFYKFFRKYIFFLFIFTFVSSLFICQFLALKTSGILNFYFTLSRGWELALGAICAYLVIYKKIYLSSLFKNILSIFGISSILLSIFYLDRFSLYPSILTLFPTVGTALIILFCDENTFIKKILSTKFLVYIGLISYSLYLWHQPLLAFGNIYFINFTDLHRFSILILSCILSVLSYKYIEKNFRNKKIIKSNLFFKATIFSFVTLLLLSQVASNFFLKKKSTEAYFANILIKKNYILWSNIDDRKFLKYRILYENLDPKILIVGSSRAMQISNEIFDRSLLNLSFNGGSIEDQISITEMALEKFNPDKIVLLAEPWFFNKNHKQIRWKSLSTEYNLAIQNIKLMNKSNIILSKSSFKEANFFERFFEKMYDFLNIKELNIDIKEDEIAKYDRDIIFRDGFRYYGKKKRARKNVIKPVEYSMTNYEFSNDNYNTYKEFLKYLKNIHKKEVILMLSPFHLPSYELTIKKIPEYSEMEQKFIQLGKQLNIKTIGSYNPIDSNCSVNEFFDRMHPKKSCMQKILNQIK